MSSGEGMINQSATFVLPSIDRTTQQSTLENSNINNLLSEQFNSQQMNRNNYIRDNPFRPGGFHEDTTDLSQDITIHA